MLVLVAVCVFVIRCSSESPAQSIPLVNRGYSVEFDLSAGIASKVEYKLYAHDDVKKASRYNMSFRQDKRVPKPRAKSSDYKGSGFERGHLAPAADFSFDESLMKETFLLSNVVPMTPQFNKGTWKRTEIAARDLANRYDSVHVVIWIWCNKRPPDTIGRGVVSVPVAIGKQVFTCQKDSLLTEFYFSNL